MSEIVVFTPDTVEMRKKGRMFQFYNISGPGDADFVCSTFHEHKANWLEKIMKDSGVKVVRGEGLAVAKPKASKNGAKKIRRIKK